MKQDETNVLLMELKQRVDLKKASLLAAKHLHEDAEIIMGNMQYMYRPYWFADISTKALRLLGPPKMIDFYAFVDAIIESENGVMRSKPKVSNEDIKNTLLLDGTVDKNKAIEIIKVLQKTRINKSFVFVRPEQVIKQVYRLYCPVWVLPLGHEGKIQKNNQQKMLINIANGNIELI